MPNASTPEARNMRAKLAAHARWANEDPKDPNGPLPRARAARWERFLDMVDPERVLPEAERNRRAEHKRQEHMLRMALASATARRKRREAREAGQEAS